MIDIVIVIDKVKLNLNIISYHAMDWTVCNDVPSSIPFPSSIPSSFDPFSIPSSIPSRSLPRTFNTFNTFITFIFSTYLAT